MPSDAPLPGRAGLRLVQVATGDPRAGADLFALLRQLRPALTARAFEELTGEGERQGPRYLLAYDAAGAPVAAAGYRVLITSRGRILFVDDLVTAGAARRAGVGAALLTAVEERGRQASCTALELDCGVGNAAAHRFYFGRLMSVLAFHFAKPLEQR